MNSPELTLADLVRPSIRSLKGYSSARSEFKGKAEIFIDANENPFETGYNRYPDPLQTELKEKISELKDIVTGHIFLGNGSDEAIDLLIRIFCEPRRDSILITEPTYGMYEVSAATNDVEILRSSLEVDYNLSAKKVLDKVQPTTKIIFLCSPNNPTGNLMPEAEVLKILRDFHGVVVIDEAYIEFSRTESWIGRIDDFERLVVLQTFSKAWGLAGLRLGMAFGNEEVIGLMNKVKPPYNISTAAQEKALEIIVKNEKKVRNWVTTLIAERERVRSALESLEVVNTVYPSSANFLLAKVTDADLIYNRLVDRGVIVRNRSKVHLCEDCLRITIGTPEENGQLIQYLKEL